MASSKEIANPHHVSVYRKFNPLQSMTYQIIMLLVLPIQFITGILLWNLTRFAGIVAFFGGVRVVDTVHVLIFICFVFYILAHAYLGTLGRTPLEYFKAMFTGYEEDNGEGGGERSNSLVPWPRNIWKLLAAKVGSCVYTPEGTGGYQQ